MDIWINNNFFRFWSLVAKNGVFWSKMALWGVIGWNKKMSQIKNPYHTISSYIKWTYEYALVFFRFGPLLAKNGVFRSKNGVFGEGSKMSKTIFFSLPSLYFQKFEKAMYPHFFVFGPLVVKNGVFRYWPPIFGGQNFFANQKPISYNIFIYKMDIWICPRFFQIWPPSCQKWRFSVKKWRFWGGVKNVKNQFFFLSISLFSKVRESNVPTVFSFLAP